MEKRTQQGKLTNLEIASFCSEMAMILKSGISSLEGVDLLREDAQTKAEKELLDEIYQSVMDTGRLDQALEETKVFPEACCTYGWHHRQRGGFRHYGCK